MSEPHLEHEEVTDDGVVVGYPAARAGTDLRLGSGARLRTGTVVHSPATTRGPVREQRSIGTRVEAVPGSAGRYLRARVRTGRPA
jgi:hypothetical protein